VRRIETPEDLRPGDSLYIEGIYSRSRQTKVFYVQKLRGDWHRVSYQPDDPRRFSFSVPTHALRLSRALPALRDLPRRNPA
jgi:hypothetical protein